MALPNEDTIQILLNSSRRVRRRVFEIARRLMELNEYGPEQALRVAADIVRTSLLLKQGVAT